MAAGPVEMASLLRHQYSQRKLKEKKKTSTRLLPPSPFTRPTRRDVTGVCVKQNWKGAQMAFSGRAYTAAGKCSQVVDWYQWHQNVHRSRHSSFPLAPAQLHARLAAQPPASILYVRFTVVSRDLTVCCVCLCVFVWCIHPRQDSEAVENQRERQASGGLQPEGWGRTDQKPIDHHIATGERSHSTNRSNTTQNVTVSQVTSQRPVALVYENFTVLAPGQTAGHDRIRHKNKTFLTAVSGLF